MSERGEEFAPSGGLLRVARRYPKEHLVARGRHVEKSPEFLPYRPGVGIVLLNLDGHIFAGQRIDNDNDAWQMPQGGIDHGELPEEAALRELTEETGLAPEMVKVIGQTSEWMRYDLPPDLIGKIWKGRFRGQEQMWFVMRFLGADADVNIATEHAEFRAWSWVKPEDMIEKIVPFKRALYQDVFEDLEEYFT